MDNNATQNVGQKLPRKNPEKDPVIKIEGIVPGTDDLMLSDGGYTVADNNTEVTWEIHTSEVTRITDIQPKSTSEDVFKQNEKPAEQPDGKWKGKTKDKRNPPVETKEYYTIFYIKADGNSAEYDPIIQVNA
jgi:hypothetical protein